jgi:2-alkyl-3-oxoalkanoate reductase
LSVKIFVAGATGVIGRRTLPLLVAAGHEVAAAARSADNAKLIGHLGARPITADLFDRRGLDGAVAGCDAVINLATHMPASSLRALLPGAWRENDRIRRIGAANLADAARAGGVQRLLQESFAPAYPDRGDEWIDETVPIAPARYNRTIVDAERAAERFTESGRTGIVLRFGTFYGPDAVQFGDLVSAIRRGFAPLPSRPQAYISSISHDDAATAVVACLQAPAGIYNIVDDEPVRRRDYFDALAQVLDVPPPRIPPHWMAYLIGSVGPLLARSQRMSNRRLREATGWVPKYPSVRDGWPATWREWQAIARA